MIKKIISGGQTGVDRAALDVALALHVLVGGWCPMGRIDELGIIPSKYDLLVEVSGDFLCEKDNYDARTRLNIHDCDGVLILVPCLPLSRQIKDGTLVTHSEASRLNKPFLLVDLSSADDDLMGECIQWIKDKNIHILNIAGPRESSFVGIYQLSYTFLSALLPRICCSGSFWTYLI